MALKVFAFNIYPFPIADKLSVIYCLVETKYQLNFCKDF